MIREKKFIIVLLFQLLLIYSRLSGQLISDPDDRIYRYLTIWYEKGYITQMPVLRPYSLQVILEMLKEVEANGDPASSNLAGDFIRLSSKAHVAQAGGKTIPGPIHIGFEQKSLSDFATGYAGKNTVQLTSTGLLGAATSYSGKISLGFVDNTDNLEPVKWTRFFDEAKTGGGVLELGDKKLGAGQLGLAGLFFGNSTLVFQAGIMRSSFGPFFDNGPVVTPEAPAAGHFSFTYNASWFSFSSLYLDLFAKYKVNPDTGAKAAVDPPAVKYLVVHNARFYPAPWCNLGIIQANLCGGVFNPVFLIPLQQAFYTQQLYGDTNNSIIGLFTEFSLPFALHFDTIFYVDDWNAFAGSSKGGSSGISLDSAQNKCSLQTGLSWSPCLDLLKQLKFSYLMITPYMYTHYADSSVDYLTYTHNGVNIGSILEPNSDQLALNLFLTPFSWMEVDFLAKYTRHGNASEGFGEPGVVSDGTVFDDGFQSDGTVTFYGPSRFLTQSVLEKVLQLGVGVDCIFPLFFTRVDCRLGYTFQYIRNKGLTTGNDELKSYLELRLLWEL